MLSDFFSLLFPKVCAVCHAACAKGEPLVCISCQSKLPKTNFHLQPGNELEQRFWGKAQISQSMAYLKFIKGGSVQQLLYKIKYKNGTELAKLLGHWYGHELKNAGIIFDMIVPVPLHKKKLRTRGYNQSEVFANGLSEAMGIPCINALERVEMKSSQTNKSRYARWENVDGIYVHNKDSPIENLHVLLVDDIITTGATAEVCANELLKSGALKVSVAGIACAD